MKKLLLLLSLPTLAFAVLVSCSQLDIFQKNDASDLIDEIANSNSKSAVEISSLPTAITSYVTTNFFETYISSAEKANRAGYEVTLGSEDVLYFNLVGTSLDSLAGCSGDSAGRGHNGPGRHHGQNPGNCGGIDSLLDVTTLPAGIQAYVTATYGDSAVIVHAKTNASGQYVVAISGHIILIFDAAGTFVETATLVHHCGGGHGTPLAIADLAASIVSYIDTNYPGAEIKVAFTKDDGKIIVGLLYNGDRKILVFDAAGNFLEVKD